MRRTPYLTPSTQTDNIKEKEVAVITRMESAVEFCNYDRVAAATEDRAGRMGMHTTALNL